MSLFGDDFTILVSDRRLTREGVLVEDESNKAVAIVLEDATLACAFTGLATYGSFSTQDWLLEALLECAPPDFLSVPTLQRLTARISREFYENRLLRDLPAQSKRLALLFAGFHFAPEGTFRVAALLTNFSGYSGVDDLPFQPTDFVLREVRMDSPSRVGFAGAWRAVADDEIADLNKMLFSGKKVDAVLGKAIDLFHEIADRPASGGTIGGQLNCIILRPDKSLPIETSYHVKNSSPICYMPNMAILTRDQSLIMKGGMIHASDGEGALLPNAPPMVVPKMHRNAICPCGSKKKYRHCHGRAREFSR